MFKQDSVSFPSFFCNICHSNQAREKCNELRETPFAFLVREISSCSRRLPFLRPPSRSAPEILNRMRFSHLCFCRTYTNTKKTGFELSCRAPVFFNIWKTPFPFYSETGPFNRRRGPTMFDAGEGRKEGIFFKNSNTSPRASPGFPHMHNSYLLFPLSFIKVCHLLRSGVAALFGPQSGTTSSHVQSICDAMEIPHIETR